MIKWRKLAVLGILALYLAGCGKSRSAEETALNATQTESAGTENDMVGTVEETIAEGSNGTEGETPAADAEEIKMSNPMQEVDGPEALSEIGVSMAVPEAAEGVQCFIISQVVAEVNFKMEETAYTYRGSATAEDFAGIFEEFEEEVTVISNTEEMAVDGDLTIKTTKSSGKLVSWSKNGAKYTLYTPSFVEEDVLLSICQELIEKN